LSPDALFDDMRELPAMIQRFRHTRESGDPGQPASS